MASMCLKQRLASFALMGLLTSAAFAQPSTIFHNTFIIDKNPNAPPPGAPHRDTDRTDFALSQLDSPLERWTLLVYPGAFEIDADPTSPDLPIKFTDTDTNIDIVGVDRDTVIIDCNSNGIPGVEIVTGIDSVPRNIAIRNLTIKCSTGAGIKITQPMGAAIPRNITLEDVTIEVQGNNAGIDAAMAEDVIMRNCLIRTGTPTGGGHGIIPGKNWTLTT